MKNRNFVVLEEDDQTSLVAGTILSVHSDVDLIKRLTDLLECHFDVDITSIRLHVTSGFLSLISAERTYFDVEVEEDFYQHKYIKMKEKEMIERIEDLERQLKDFKEKVKTKDKFIQLGSMGLTHKDFGKLLETRTAGEYSGVAFYLSSLGGLNWELKRDSKDLLCLIPTKK